MQSAGYTALALGCAGIVALAACGPADWWFSRFFRFSALRTLGRYSYALYLFHVPVRRFIRDATLSGGIVPDLARFTASRATAVLRRCNRAGAGARLGFLASLRTAVDRTYVGDFLYLRSATNPALLRTHSPVQLRRLHLASILKVYPRFPTYQ